MDRRSFMKILGLAGPATIALTGEALASNGPIAPSHPPIDQPWPIDIRPGFETIADPWHCAVFIDGVKAKGVQAVSTKTGHVLAFRMTGSHIVQRQQPCRCAPGMHRFLRGSDSCVPLEIRTGRVCVIHGISALFDAKVI